MMKTPNRILSLASLLFLVSCGAQPCVCSVESSNPSSPEVTSSAEESSVLNPSSEEPSSEASISSESSEVTEESSLEPSPESPISLYNPNSKLVLPSFLPNQSVTLPTYHHKDLGDVPYVNLGELLHNYWYTGFIQNYVELTKLSDELYAVKAENMPVMTFDSKLDKVSIFNFDHIHPMGGGINNGIGNDIASPENDPESSFHSSSKTHYIWEPSTREIDFSRYHFDLVSEGEDLYVPFQPVSDLFFATATFEFLYNGADFYTTLFAGADYFSAYPGTYCSVYANTDCFAYARDIYEKVDPVGDEVYRFACQESENVYSVFSFGKEGALSLRTCENLSQVGQEYNGKYNFSYEDKEDGLYVTMTHKESQRTSLWKIPKTPTYFNAHNRSKSIAQHTFDVLRFQFENLYGLRKGLYGRYEVSDFDELLNKAKLTEKLLSSDSSVYDSALAELLMRYIDDGHTKYNGRSLFSGLPNVGVYELSEPFSGERRSYLLSKYREYSKLRGEVLSEIDEKYEDPSKRQDLFIENKTACIRFDDFALVEDGNLLFPNFKDGRKPVSEDINQALHAATADGFYLAFREIETHPEIENVVIDLTCNGGGASPLMPYLSAYWTSDPIFLIFDTICESLKEYHYEADINRNGVFNEPEDTYEGKYNFYVLTSDFSFSCANGLPTLAHNHGAKVIGKPSGGGACPVATFCDGSGTIFACSMPAQIVYEVGPDNYRNNDGGAPLDYELDESYWYDMEKLDQWLASISE